MRESGSLVVELAVLTVGAILAITSGVLAYRAVGLYGDGPFAKGFHRERDASTGRWLLVQDFQTSTGRGRRVIDEALRVTELRLDTNLDGVDDGRIMMSEGAFARIGFSSKGDGVIDAWAFRDATNQIVRIEMSTRRDGRIDRWEHYTNGQLVRVDLDTNLNGQPDQRQIYEKGTLIRTENDANEDGRPDDKPVS
jgi:hypothetical protein